MKNKIILFAFILVSSCSSLPKNDKAETLNTLIQKPEFNYKISYLPQSIEIYFFKEDKSSAMPSEIKGFIANSYFYNSKIAYKPKILLSPIIDGECNINKKKEDLVIIFNLSNDPFYLRCIEDLSKKKALYVSSFEDKLGFNNSFIVSREEEKARLISELIDTTARFVVIDSNSTLDKKDITRLLKKNKKEILDIQSFDGVSSSQNLIAEILMVNRSKERARKIARRLSKNIVGDTRSRTDIDSFFLSVDLEEARSLKPAIDYISEKDFNIFILNSWEMNSIYYLSDKDLSGSYHSDLPVMMPIKLPEYIPTNGRSRGFAIGYDTFEILLLKYGSVRLDNFVYKGLSGKIELRRENIKRSAYVFKINDNSIEIL